MSHLNYQKQKKIVEKRKNRRQDMGGRGTLSKRGLSGYTDSEITSAIDKYQEKYWNSDGKNKTAQKNISRLVDEAEKRGLPMYNVYTAPAGDPTNNKETLVGGNWTLKGAYKIRDDTMRIDKNLYGKDYTARYVVRKEKRHTKSSDYIVNESVSVNKTGNFGKKGSKTYHYRITDRDGHISHYEFKTKQTRGQIIKHHESDEAHQLPF